MVVGQEPVQLVEPASLPGIEGELQDEHARETEFVAHARHVGGDHPEVLGDQRHAA